MTKTLSSTITFEKITGAKEQIVVLYDLLDKRKHNISHRAIPSFSDHADFVNNHPYRVWYLIKSGDIYVGSFYISKYNSVGISIISNQRKTSLITLNFIFNKYKPLKEIKSLRPPYFYINVPVTNKYLEKCLASLGATKVQTSYSLSATLKPK
jgi:hypothetical protein